MLARFRTADGFVVTEPIPDLDYPNPRRCIRKALKRAPFPSDVFKVLGPILDEVSQVREYYYAGLHIENGVMVALYEEHVPKYRVPVTVHRLALALFKAEHYCEALEIADGKVEDVARVLQVMQEKTKRDSMNECIGRAAAIFGNMGIDE